MQMPEVPSTQNLIPFDYTLAGWKRDPSRDLAARGGKAKELAWLTPRGQLLYIEEGVQAFKSNDPVPAIGDMPPLPAPKMAEPYSINYCFCYEPLIKCDDKGCLCQNCGKQEMPHGILTG